MPISKDEYLQRMSEISALEDFLNNIRDRIYDRKADVLRDYFGFQIDEINDEYIGGHIFSYDGHIFLDIDHAFEFAEENLES